MLLELASPHFTQHNIAHHTTAGVLAQAKHSTLRQRAQLMPLAASCLVATCYFLLLLVMRQAL